MRPWTRFVEIDPEAVNDYAEHWGHHDAWYQGALRTGRISVGLISRGDQLIGAAREHALNALTSAVFVLDSSGKPVYANQSGEELIRQERWMRLERGSLAPAKTLLDSARIVTALERARLGVGCKIMVTDTQTGGQACLCAAPLPVTERPYFESADPCAVVWVTAITPPEDTAEDMALLFNLTPAERRLLRRLIAGAELAEAAAGLRLSIHTARTQLKSMFRKTGRRSQSQLLLLAAGVATLSSRR